MRLTTLFTIILLTFNSCKTDKLENNAWTNCQNNISIQSYFNFALNNTSSTYLDSALIILNDSLKLDKSFCLIFKEDSNLFYKDRISSDGIRKNNLLLIDINSGTCLYEDTLITNNDSINNKIDWFTTLGQKHLIWILADSLESYGKWISLFNRVKQILINYNLTREKYSKTHWNTKFDKLDFKRQILVKENIPINLTVFFQNPIPPPPNILNDRKD